MSLISASMVTWWALGCGPAETTDVAAGGDITRQWAKEVALGTEFGGDGVIARWTHPVRISVMSGSTTSDLQDAVALMSSLLTPSGITIEQAPDQDATADVEVHLTTLDSFGRIAEENGFEYVPGNLGFFYVFWDADHGLSKAYVLLASDRLAGEEMRHFMFEELTQSFGFGNDSAVYSESIFYAKGLDGGNAQTLSALDRKLVNSCTNIWTLVAMKTTSMQRTTSLSRCDDGSGTRGPVGTRVS